MTRQEVITCGCGSTSLLGAFPCSFCFYPERFSWRAALGGRAGGTSVCVGNLRARRTPVPWRPRRASGRTEPRNGRFARAFRRRKVNLMNSLLAQFLHEPHQMCVRARLAIRRGAAADLRGELTGHGLGALLLALARGLWSTNLPGHQGLEAFVFGPTHQTLHQHSPLSSQRPGRDRLLGGGRGIADIWQPLQATLAPSPYSSVPPSNTSVGQLLSESRSLPRAGARSRSMAGTHLRPALQGYERATPPMPPPARHLPTSGPTH